MLEVEPGDSGQQVTLHASGILRFLPAAFLAAWLCGWAVGEWFALRLLATMLRQLLGPGFALPWLPVVGGRFPSGPALPIFMVFVLFWLSLWTFGGIGAARQFLGLLFGRDVVRWGEDALEIEHRALWIVVRERLAAQDIAGFRVFGGALVADTRRRAVRVTSLTSAEDRVQLLSMLQDWRRGFGAPAALSADESPVPMFVTFRDETGTVALMSPPGPRRSLGAMLGLLGLVLFAAVASQFTQKTGASLVVGALFFGVFGAGCLYGSLWLLAGSESWHMAPGRLERRRTLFGHTWTVVFAPLELELTSARDSKGYMRWSLVVSGAGRTQTIATAIDDPNVPSTLGTWLAERTGARFIRPEDAALRQAS